MRHSNIIRIFVYRKTTDNQFIILYLRMKKEFGKWLMDIAKYITTAVILTSIFGEVEQKWIIYFGGILAVAFTLGWGLYLVRDKKKGE